MADFVLADLSEADEGTSWEIGFAHSLNIPIYAIGQKRNVMLSFEINYISSVADISFSENNLISIEGIDGVGKSFALHALGYPNDDTLDGFGLRLFQAMNTDDLFLRSGNPLSEAFVFLAIDLKQGKILDRGIDTIAIYYALQCEDFISSYFQIYSFAKKIKRVPSKTILLVDSFESILSRLEKREKRKLSL